MNDYKIVKLESRHLAEAENWIPTDVSKTLLKVPITPNENADDNFSWAAVKDKEVLAIASVQLNKDHVGYLNCLVKPNEGGHGIGTTMIDFVIKQPEIDNLIHLHTLVAQENIAAQKILEDLGFTRIGYGSDNQIEFARHKYQNNN